MKVEFLAKDVPDLIREVANHLSTNGRDEARLKAEFLISHVLAIRRLNLYLERDRLLDKNQLKELTGYVRRAAQGEPIQYILGETDFMGFLFKTDRRALIPRPETENLVEFVINCNALWELEKPRVVDVGTGSGCIVVALALMQPQGEYTAVDVCAETLALAEENAKRHNVNRAIRFMQNDLLKDWPPESVDAVVSNPPYISTDDYHGLDVEVRDHEPRTALDGGKEGLEIIDRLTREAFWALRKGGFLFMEIGDAQSEQVAEHLTSTGFQDAHISKDLAGRDRIVHGRKP